MKYAELRTTLTIAALAASLGGPSHAQSAAPAAPLAVRPVFAILARADSDFSDLAMKCLDTCLDQEPSLDYLFRKGGSEDAYAKVEHAPLPVRLLDLQRRTLEQIRGRIESAKAKAH